MLLKLTEHYKGRLPVDMGGVTFAGYGFKDVQPDAFAEILVKANFPRLAPCDRDGKYLVDVPPVPVEKKPEVKAEVKVEPSKSVAPLETEDVALPAADQVPKADKVVVTHKPDRKK